MILHLFTLLFTGLKLTHVIDWSWWYITMPSWGLFAFAFLLIVLGKAFEGLEWLFSTPEQRNRRALSKSLKELSKRLGK